MEKQNRNRLVSFDSNTKKQSISNSGEPQSPELKQAQRQHMEKIRNQELYNKLKEGVTNEDASRASLTRGQLNCIQMNNDFKKIDKMLQDERIFLKNLRKATMRAEQEAMKLDKPSLEPNISTDQQSSLNTAAVRKSQVEMVTPKPR